MIYESQNGGQVRFEFVEPGLLRIRLETPDDPVLLEFDAHVPSPDADGVLAYGENQYLFRPLIGVLPLPDQDVFFRISQFSDFLLTWLTGRVEVVVAGQKQFRQLPVPANHPLHRPAADRLLAIARRRQHEELRARRNGATYSPWSELHRIVERATLEAVQRLYRLDLDGTDPSQWLTPWDAEAMKKAILVFTLDSPGESDPASARRETFEAVARAAEASGWTQALKTLPGVPGQVLLATDAAGSTVPEKMLAPQLFLSEGGRRFRTAPDNRSPALNSGKNLVPLLTPDEPFWTTRGVDTIPDMLNALCVVAEGAYDLPGLRQDCIVVSRSLAERLSLRWTRRDLLTLDQKINLNAEMSLTAAERKLRHCEERSDQARTELLETWVFHRAGAATEAELQAAQSRADRWTEREARAREALERKRADRARRWEVVRTSYCGVPQVRFQRRYEEVLPLRDGDKLYAEGDVAKGVAYILEDEAMPFIEIPGHGPVRAEVVVGGRGIAKHQSELLATLTLMGNLAAAMLCERFVADHAAPWSLEQHLELWKRAGLPAEGRLTVLSPSGQPQGQLTAGIVRLGRMRQVATVVGHSHGRHPEARSLRRRVPKMLWERLDGAWECPVHGVAPECGTVEDGPCPQCRKREWRRLGDREIEFAEFQRRRFTPEGHTVRSAGATPGYAGLVALLNAGQRSLLDRSLDPGSMTRRKLEALRRVVID